jgi:hypothetical protein
MRRITLPFIAVGLIVACGDSGTNVQVSSPVIDSIWPASGTIGTEVQVFGSGFANGAQVYFSGGAAGSVALEGGSLFATAPAGLASGSAHDVRVENPDGGAATLTDAYELIPPEALRINGVSRPTGFTGMTVIIEGDAFGDDLALSEGAVFFSSSGGPIEAAIADAANDWTNTFIVTSVPVGIPDTSQVWVETATGVSDSIEFRLIQTGSFSPSDIDWTLTTALPQPLQGLGAAFVPVEDGPSPASYVFAVGGADSTAVPTNVVYRSVAEQTGALQSWDAVTPLPDERAFHTTVAATAFTAALDTATTAAYLYVVGGQDSTGTVMSSTHYAHVDLDGVVGDWQAGPDLPEPIQGAGATIFRGYLYLVGGQDTAGSALATAYRAKVNDDGSLGSWESLPDMPRASAFGSVVSFGPYIYSVAGESDGVPAVQEANTGSETSSVYLARINLRTGGLRAEGWVETASLQRGRSKHSALVGGGAIFTTSGIYAGQVGSLENVYAPLQTGGAGVLEPWNGATGSELVQNELGYGLYNQAAVYFIDQNGVGHVLVLGGARRDQEGVPSAGVVYY